VVCRGAVEVPLVRRHLELYVDDHPEALLLTGIQGGPLDPMWFAQQLWEPARATFVEEARESCRDTQRVLRKLESLRRHDLRHAAASFWLRVPVSPKLAQRWGGWRDLSTFLDVYQGVSTGEEDEAVPAGERPPRSSRPAEPRLAATSGSEELPSGSRSDDATRTVATSRRTIAEAPNR